MTVTDEQCEAVITTRAQFFMAKRAHEEAREAGKEWADETAHQAAKEKAYEEAYDEELAEARATVKEKLLASESRTKYLETRVAYEYACEAAGVDPSLKD